MKDRITFGNYNGKQLEWISLYRKNNGVYILEEPICRMSYDNGNEEYSNSLIRHFLVDDFMPNAFSDNELEKLLPNKEACNDRVWLISYFDVNSYFKTNLSIFKEKNYWWMRGHNGANNFSLATAGAFCKWSLNAELAKGMECGVRPCIKLNTIGE